MGLSERQHLLARLLTDAGLRMRFLSDPVAVGQDLALRPDDITSLAALVMQDVERSARSLCVKRWNEIEKLMPLSVCAADQGQVPLRQWFLQFAQTWTPQGDRRHVQDAITFARWFTQQSVGGLLESEGVALPWLSDLLRYEAAWLSASLDTRARFVLIQRFHFPVHHIARALAQNVSESLTTANLLSRASLGIWVRGAFSHNLRHFVLMLP